MGRIADVARLVRENYRQVRAESEGKAISRARMLKQAKDVPELKAVMDKYRGPVRPIIGATHRTLDGKPMVFFTDGSLRHALGRRVGKAARKLLKRQRHAALLKRQRHAARPKD